MKKIVLLAAVVAMLAAFAVPATADPNEVGVINGIAAVGKEGECAQDGTGTATGSGLGVPVVTGEKTGFWTLNTTITGVLHGVLGTGDLRACGLLGPVVDGTPTGAACGISRGHDGKGTVAIGGVDHISLTNLGWVTSAGGTIPVTGNTTDPGTKDKNGTVVAIVQAQGGAACASKTGPDKDGNGATSFTVVGTFAATDAVEAPKA